jgi:hypothetical protein
MAMRRVQDKGRRTKGTQQRRQQRAEVTKGKRLEDAVQGEMRDKGKEKLGL